MKKVLLMLVAVFGLSLVAPPDSEAARRFGGGKSMGQQRNMTTPPAQKAPAQQSAATPTTPQPQSGMSRWLGPLAGLALGAGLASLFLNNGLAGGLAGIFLLLAIGAGVFFLVRMFRAKTSARPLEYAGAAAGRQSPAPAPSDLSTRFGGGGGANEPVMAARRFPVGFDADQFVHHAKINFTELQACNDQRDLATMRDFMTPALYSEIAADLQSRGEESQKTEVGQLEANVVEVVTESDKYVASVRFTGTMRENDGVAEPFSEVWHLEKPVNGRSGWLISGIQQD